MNDCLLKKLKGSFDNGNLLKIGEIRFKALVNNASIQFQFSDRQQQTATAISGTITQAWSSGVLTVTGTTAGTVFSIPDKYKIKFISSVNMAIVGNDTDILNYSPFEVFILDNQGSYDDDNKVTGDITAILEKTTLTFINLRNQKTTGSISPLANNNIMVRVILPYQDMSGQLSDIVSTAIKAINLPGTQVSGNLSDIASKTLLEELRVPENVSGDVSNLPNSLVDFEGAGNYSGDLSQVSSVLKNFVSHAGGSFSWTTRPTTSTIFSIGRATNYMGTGINLGSYLDTYLTNIVNCTLSSSAMKINIAGTESGNTATLAAALKTKISAVSGSTLTINGTSY